MISLVNFGRIYDHNVNISAHRLGEDGKVRVWLETNILPTNHPVQVLEMTTSKSFQNVEIQFQLTVLMFELMFIGLGW